MFQMCTDPVTWFDSFKTITLSHGGTQLQDDYQRPSPCLLP